MSSLSPSTSSAATGALPGRIPKPPSLDKVVQRITEVSTLPHIAIKVMEVANDPDAGAAELKNVVEADASLSARVLKTVNSSAYALRVAVTSLHQAISLLGFSQVRNLAITASVSESFKKDQTIGSYRRSRLWRHLVSVGLCARLIAARRSMPDFEDAFLAGLLHDFGIILEDQYVHEPFEAMMSSLDTSRPLVDTEQEHLGFDHTTLGARIAESWKFPPVVRATIRLHHMSDNCQDDAAPIVVCVEIANFLCTLKGISSVGEKLVEPPRRAVASLGLTKEDLKVLAVDLDEEMSRHDSLFQL